VTLGDLAYRVEGKAVRTLYQCFGARPSSEPYISGDSFRALADHVVEGGERIVRGRVREGDVVFVAGHELERFRSECLPAIDARFVLVSHNSDFNIDEEVAAMADDPRIIRWFAQNCLVRHPKIVPIPIGLENKSHYNFGVVRDFARVARASSLKKPRILYGFAVGTNEGERGPALEALRSSGAADEVTRTNARAYRRILASYRFVASPAGNGVDCHRTWEALYLGVVPIVKRSAFFDGFPGLPVLAVDEWRDILDWDEEELGRRHEALWPSIHGYEGLWMQYWKRLINEARVLEGPGEHGL
jgi:hypothetical protein